MARLKKLAFATFNLYNLNKPGLPMYRNRHGITEAVYDKKVGWTRFMLEVLAADVYGFQELWHTGALADAFEGASLDQGYTLLSPAEHAGGKIICAGAVRSDILVDEPVWIEAFPEEFKLHSSGDDPQTPDVSVTLNAFSRPVLNFKIKPRPDRRAISVYVCHFKSKRPTDVYREGWYRAEDELYKPHKNAIGAGLSTIRRTAEATALRIILDNEMKKTDTPVVVLGDLNDGQHSNTLNILTEQPRYLSPLSSGGRDNALYSGQTLQQYRSQRDVYYTHVFQGARESLDHILVSEQFYDNSKKRVWAFDALQLYNDHLNREAHKQDDGTGDHGLARAVFKYKPA